MRASWKWINNERGSMTVAFLAYIAMFLFILVFLINFMQFWFSKSTSQLAADAASLQASELLNNLMVEDLQPVDAINIKVAERMNLNPLLTRADAVNAVCNYLNDDEKNSFTHEEYDKIPVADLILEVVGFDQPMFADRFKLASSKAQEIIAHHQQEFIDDVTNALAENGAKDNSGNSHGEILFGNITGKITVVATTQFKPVSIENVVSQLAPKPTQGEGSGPFIKYLEKMQPLSPINF
jgi:hypothetical protein